MQFCYRLDRIGHMLRRLQLRVRHVLHGQRESHVPVVVDGWLTHVFAFVFGDKASM